MAKKSRKLKIKVPNILSRNFGCTIKPYGVYSVYNYILFPHVSPYNISRDGNLSNPQTASLPRAEATASTKQIYEVDIYLEYYSAHQQPSSCCTLGTSPASMEYVLQRCRRMQTAKKGQQARAVTNLPFIGQPVPENACLLHEQQSHNTLCWRHSKHTQ